MFNNSMSCLRNHTDAQIIRKKKIKPDRMTFCGVQVSHTSLNKHLLSVEVSINSWKVLKRFVESIFLNTSSRIEVFSSYDASMGPSRSTLHIYLGINVINVL